MKPYWEITNEDVQRCLDATQWYPASLEYFRGGGYSSNYMSKGGMPMTMSRINMVDGLGPVLQIAEGWSVELPDKVAEAVDKRTDKTWPTTWFVPRLTSHEAFDSVYSVMANWGLIMVLCVMGILVRSLSLSLLCCEYRYVCTTYLKKEYSVLLHGHHLGWIKKVPISRHVQHMVRSTNRER